MPRHWTVAGDPQGLETALERVDERAPMEPWLAAAGGDPRKPHASAPQPGRHPVGGRVHVALLRLRGAAEAGELYDAMRAPEPNERQQHPPRA